jgi:hypothetical protein
MLTPFSRDLMRSAIYCLLFAGFIGSTLAARTAAYGQGTSDDLQSDRVRLEDNSDWWSDLRVDRSGRTVLEKYGLGNVRRDKPDPSNLRILGVNMVLDSMQPSDKIRPKVGKATVVERGDAAAGREQICYAARSGKAKVIFEDGECDTTFYVIGRGPTWNGIEYCSVSDRVSDTVTTGSGIKLGMTPAQVERILGKPSMARDNVLLYTYEVPNPSPGLTPQNWSPDAVDKVFIIIKASFTKSALSLLAVKLRGC